MDKLTLGMQIKQQYPGSYDDIPDDQLGDLVMQKYGRDAGAAPDDEFEGPSKVWEWLTNPIAPEVDREKFMPIEESGPSGKLQQFIGEAAYQFYRGVVRPSTSPLGVAMGAGLAVPGIARKATLGAMGIMGLTGAAEGIERLADAGSHGDRINAAVDTALSGLMGIGGLAGAASLPRNVIEAPITKIPRVFRNWRQWARATPEQQAALGGESKTVPQWKQLELPIRPPEFDPVWYSQIEGKAQQPETRRLSDPWYTFKSLKSLGSTLFKPDKRGKIPPGVPAANFMDALNNPQIIPAGDAFWLGLRHLGERKMRSGDTVSWQDIVGTIEDNLSLSQIYRSGQGRAGAAIRDLAYQYADAHPDVQRLRDEATQADRLYAMESDYADKFGGFVRDRMSREAEILFRKKSDPRIKPLFVDEYNYELNPGGAASRLMDILYEDPDQFYKALQLEDADAASRASSWTLRNQGKIRKEMDVIDKASPGLGGLVRIYMELADRARQQYTKNDKLLTEADSLHSQLRSAYGRKQTPETPDGEVSPESPIYRNYSGIPDGADYETNVVVAKRRSFGLVDEKMQEISERINWIDTTLHRPAEVTPAVEWLRAERDRLSDQYNYLHESKQFAEYNRGHIREQGSVGHYRWDGRMTRDAQHGNEGWTAFAQEIQSDWNETVRRNGMKGDFKSKDFEKIWQVMQEVKVLADQNYVLKNGSFGKYMNEVDVGEPVFPDFKNLPDPNPWTWEMEQHFQNNEVKIGNRTVPPHWLTPEQRQQLIASNDAAIAKLHESVRREMGRYYGGDLEYKREPIYEYEHYSYDTGYRVIGYNEGWVPKHRPADYSEAVGPFVDDANKVNELLMKAFIRRALVKGMTEGRQYEYIGIRGGKLSAFAQGYGEPWKYVEIAPAGTVRSGSAAGQQPLLGTYNIRGYNKLSDYSGDVYYNQTIKDISEMFGEEIANRIASEAWGSMKSGEPILEPIDHSDRQQIQYFRSHSDRSFKTKKARDRMFNDLLKSQGYFLRDEQYFKVPDSAWDMLPSSRERVYGQIDNWVPHRFELSEPAVLPSSAHHLSTYKGQVNAYDGMNKGILSRIAKEFGSELEEGRAQASGTPSPDADPSNPRPEEFWYRIWRMKVTPKMLETVLYGMTGVNP